MQKKIIALAVAGLASTAAFAQTNVTVYGVADGTFDYVWQDNGRSSTYTESFDVNSLQSLGSSYTEQKAEYGGNTRVSANSSYLGFKGTEDLGNGLKAVFQYEIGFDFTTGTGLGGARDSFVGLSSGMGTVLLGNLTGPTRGLGAAVDVFPGATGIGANSALLGKIAGSTLKGAPVTVSGFNAAGDPNALSATLGFGCGKGTTCTSIFDTRWENAIAYVSPNIMGFTAVGAYVANENKTRDYNPVTLAQEAAQLDTTGYDVGLKWEGAGFMAGVAYNAAQLGDFLDTEVDNIRVAGMYSNSLFSIRGLWEQTSIDLNNNLTGFANSKQQKMGVGATFNIGKATLVGQWYGTNSADNLDDSKANLYTVGVLYNLSKRTMLKATYAMLDNDDGSAADFGVNAVGGSSLSAKAGLVGNTATVTATDNGFGSTYQGIQVGVRHSF